LQPIDRTVNRSERAAATGRGSVPPKFEGHSILITLVRPELNKAKAGCGIG
jgi:hypothetical protein